VKHSAQVGLGVGGFDADVGDVDAAPSCVHVALFPGWVHITFCASWSTAVSNPLAKPLFWAASPVTVLPLLLLAANADFVDADVPAVPTTNAAAINTATIARVFVFVLFIWISLSPVTMLSVYLKWSE
jgi:hypothetical protein